MTDAELALWIDWARAVWAQVWPYWSLALAIWGGLLLALLAWSLGRPRRTPKPSQLSGRPNPGASPSAHSPATSPQPNVVPLPHLARPVGVATIAAPRLPQVASAPVAGPTPVAHGPRPTIVSGDTEFLPAALELILTPASPLAAAVSMTICATLAAAVVWSYVSLIDIHAIAIGKVQPSGRSKVVQPLETGRVVVIGVENGSVVSEGAPLLELDATETGADRTALAKELETASAEAERRRAAVTAARSGEFVAGAVVFPPTISADVRRRETDVLDADLGQLRSTVASLTAQSAEKQATQRKLDMSIVARRELIKLTKERVEMRETLEKSGAGSRAMIIESLQQYEVQKNADAGDRGQLLEVEAAIRSLERKREEVVAQFIADQSQKLAEAERKRDRAQQELIKAQSKSDRTVLRAPIAGVVQQLSVTTVGQVVASGQSLLTVVPQGGPIEVEALVTNSDIGFVTVGQPAVVKVDAFPFTRYGTIDAVVTKISTDGVDPRSAAATSDSSAGTRPQGVASQPQSAADTLVYPATIKLSQNSITVDGKQIPLIAGMSVSVEIKTGARRAIDYVLAPLREIATQTAHER